MSQSKPGPSAAARGIKFTPAPAWMCVVSLAAAIALALWGHGPPSSRGLPADFVPRAMAHVDVVARSPHPMGSAALLDVRAYIVDRLTEFGLEPRVDETTLFEADGWPHTANGR